MRAASARRADSGVEASVMRTAGDECRGKRTRPEMNVSEGLRLTAWCVSAVANGRTGEGRCR